MPKVLTQQQIDQYHEQGFIAPVDVMTEDKALSYKRRLEIAERDYPQAIGAKKRNNVHLSFTCFDELVHHPVIVDAVEDLIGVNIALWGSVLFIKEPHSAGYVSWHQDVTYMGIEPHDFVTPWLALTPSNPDNGCMSMLPGSHNDTIYQHDDTFEDNNILTRGQVARNIDTSKAVDLILRPGQMSLHHAKIIHGSQPNCSAERRIGFAIQSYMPAYARQVIGKNYWLPIRGEQLHKDHIVLQRPRFDGDPISALERQKADDNFSAILYQGARKKRDY